MPIIHGKPRRWHQRRGLDRGRFQSLDEVPEIAKAAKSRNPEAKRDGGSGTRSITRLSAQTNGSDIQQHTPLLAADVRSAAARMSSTPDLDMNTITSPVKKTSEVSTNSSSETDSESESELDPDIESSSAAARERPEFYYRFITNCEQDGPTMANRGESARKMIRTEDAKWNQ